MSTHEIRAILQISDLHFGIKPVKEYSDLYLMTRRQVLSHFFDHLKEYPLKQKPDVIVISGDLGWEGKNEDYGDELKDFLRAVLESTELTLEDIIVCPGNHDKDNSINAEAKRPIINDTAFLNDDLANGIVTEREKSFEAFASFWKEFEVDGRHLKKLKNKQDESNACETKGDISKYLYGWRELKDIEFLVLNSAWDCDYTKTANEADRHSLRVGAKLVGEVLSYTSKYKVNEEGVVVTVLHHPLDFLHITETESLPDAKALPLVELIKQNSDLILTGHIHKGDDKTESSGPLIYGCGTLHSTDVSQYSCQILQINMVTKVVLPFRYYYKEPTWVWEQPDSVYLEKLEERVKRSMDTYKFASDQTCNRNNHIENVIRETIIEAYVYLKECNKARSAADVSSEVIMELINQGEKYIGKLEALKKFHEEIDKIDIINETSIQDLLRQVREMLSYWRKINQEFDKDKGLLLKLSLDKKNLGGGKKDE